MNKIIGITGLQGSGKDTLGDIICENFDNFEKDSFASILKDATSILFNWDRKMLAGQTSEDRAKREEIDEFWSKELGFDLTPRKALQLLGTELFRKHFHNNFWVIALKRKLLSTNKNTIVCDCRFPNEINMIKSLGGKIIRMERNIPDWFRKVESYQEHGIDNLMYDIPYYIPELNNVHESEWRWVGQDHPDLIIKNDKTLEDLKENSITKIKELIG